MRRRLALVLAAATLGPIRTCSAVRPLTPAAPEFPEGAAWLNSKPFSLKALKDKRVIVIAFLNTSTIDSIRSLRRLNRWWEQYALHGLLVIGVHASDFDFDRDPLVVREALRRLKIRFPVVLDSGRRIWRAYSNEGWPALYLIDHKARIIHDQLGEGGLAEFEHELLDALGRLNGYKAGSYRVPEDAPRADCQKATPARYLGARHGTTIGEVKRRSLEAILEARDGELGRAGPWTADAEALRFAGADNASLSAQVSLIYAGAEAHAVLARKTPKPTRVYVKQDDLWMRPDNAGADIRFDDSDRSYVTVDAPRLYYIAKNARGEPHDLRLIPSARGTDLYSFEFSDRCQTDYDHR